jgi:hypothetical protein
VSGLILTLARDHEPFIYWCNWLSSFSAAWLSEILGRSSRPPPMRSAPPTTCTGSTRRTYSWRWLCESRRRQLDAWKAARPQQPALFDLKDDSRPAWEHNAAPSLLAWLQVYGSCSGSTQPHL